MSKYGNRHRSDANTKEIVEELRKLPDVSAEYIARPVDLLIGYRGLNYAVEIKNKDGRDKRGESWERQLKFIAEYRGSVLVCHTLEEVLNGIGYQRSA